MVNLLWSNPLPTPQFASLSILLQLDIPEQYSNSHHAKINQDDANDNSSNHHGEQLTAALTNNSNLQVSTISVQLPNNTGTKEVPLYPKGLIVNYLPQQTSSDSQDDSHYHHDNDSPTTTATILEVHHDNDSRLEPYYTIRLHGSGMDKRTDNAHLAQLQPHQPFSSGEDDPTTTTTNNSNPQQHPPPCRHAVLSETMTVITPHTLLSEQAHLECMEGLHRDVMERYALRDDFLGVGQQQQQQQHGDDAVSEEVDEMSDIVDSSEEEEEGLDVVEDVGSSSSTHMMNNQHSKVRFGNGTKEGTTTTTTTTTATTTEKARNHQFGNLPIRIYKPKYSLLGMTMYYLAVYVEDIPKLIQSVEKNDEKNDSHPSINKARLFQHVASVLVPGISLSSKKNNQLLRGGGGGGVILLTVGSTGPPYDLYGASSIIATLPQRLRDCMKQLSAVDTSTTRKEVLLSSEEVRRQVQLEQLLLSEKDGSLSRTRFPFLGKSMTNRSIQQQQQKLLQELGSQSASASGSSTTKYDAVYYNRLYMALLATILDDEDGFMREHEEEVVIQSYPFSPQSVIAKTSQSPSILGGLIDQSSSSSSTLKKNRFTFSRRKVKNDQEYSFGNGGDTGIQDFKSDTEGGKEDPSTTHTADIIRREAQKLEVLSIAEEDMPIPRYSHLIGENKKSSSSASPRGRKSPRKGGGVTAASGRFGRPAVPSDLSGFEYRPSAQQRMIVGGGGMSVSGFTSSTSEVSEDVSVMTGDLTAYTTSSQSSVPTLSRSKRDDSSSSSSSSRSRRFMFMKKKKEKSPKRKKGQPLLSIPQDQELQQPVYDPFGNDDDEGHANNSSSGKGVFLSPSAKSAPVDLDDTPPESPQKAIVNDLNKSYSYESEGKESDVSAPESNTSTAPESIEEPEPELEPEPEPEPEPTRHLDVSLALNEDLTCEYKQSKLSTLTVEGTIQVRMSLSYEGAPPQDAPSSIPFNILFKDSSGHVRTLQENKKFVENMSNEREAANREFTYAINIPREEEYFPVIRYKCDTSLRPVPIRVQSRVRTQGKLCRVALQISSNPQNPSDLVQLTVIMGVPPGLKGESLKCNPPGGVWNESKRVVVWCVSELGGGEKFQLQAILEMSDELLRSGIDPAERLEFPVMARCQCVGAQLSDVELDVSHDDMFPAAMSKNFIRRFRVSHKEKK